MPRSSLRSVALTIALLAAALAIAPRAEAQVDGGVASPRADGDGGVRRRVRPQVADADGGVPERLTPTVEDAGTPRVPRRRVDAGASFREVPATPIPMPPLGGMDAGVFEPLITTSVDGGAPIDDDPVSVDDGGTSASIDDDGMAIAADDAGALEADAAALVVAAEPEPIEPASGDDAEEDESPRQARGSRSDEPSLMIRLEDGRTVRVDGVVVVQEGGGGGGGIAQLPGTPIADPTLFDRGDDGRKGLIGVEGFLSRWGGERAGGVFGLLFALTLLLVLASGLRRAREKLPVAGIVPRIVAYVHVGVRILAFLVLLDIGSRIVPASMAPAIPWVILAAAVGLGWSLRDVLPDVVSGLVLTFERRVRRGTWISGAGFAGTVDSVGLRATWLRDVRGHRIAVPNRQMLTTPVTTDYAVGADQQVALRIDREAPAADIRQALADAVLLSPWIAPRARPIVLRDSNDPKLWHVRGRLLDARYALAFEGELLERAEEILDSRARNGSSGAGTPDEDDQPNGGTQP